MGSEEEMRGIGALGSYRLQYSTVLVNLGDRSQSLLALGGGIAIQKWTFKDLRAL
jgi:hypothetical protein